MPRAAASTVTPPADPGAPMRVARPLLASLLLLAPPAAVAADAPAAFVPTDSQRALHRALSVRHDPPPCTALQAHSTALADDLAVLVAHATQPPVVGMRAASCLLTAHTEAARPLARQWVADPAHRGLALLTLNQLDALPPAFATELAQLAAVGPLREAALPRIARAADPAVAGIADQPRAALPPLPDDLRPAPTPEQP